MTLFIAYILMNYIGGFETSTYVLVFVLWLLHLLRHPSVRYSSCYRSSRDPAD